MVALVYQKNREKGLGLVEYAFLVALLALVIIVPTLFLGSIIGNVFSKIGNPLYTDNGGPPATATLAATPTPTWITCAVEGAFCSFSGTTLVRYGANSSWITGPYTNGVWCTNAVFTDPLVGTYKSCQIFR